MVKVDFSKILDEDLLNAVFANEMGWKSSWPTRRLKPSTLLGIVGDVREADLQQRLISTVHETIIGAMCRVKIRFSSSSWRVSDVCSRRARH